MFFLQEPSADKYLLRVTAGPAYDLSTHVAVHVNKPEPTRITSPLAEVELNVRIKGYRGLPPDCPPTSGYFERGTHAVDGDRYSICLRFTPKRPPGWGDPAAPEDGSGDGGETSRGPGGESTPPPPHERGIPGEDLQFGNDLDKPLGDFLPPGFNTAINILKWWVDPGLEGDVYSDTPHLFGPALSSFNTVHCGPGTCDESVGLVFSEGGDEKGMEMREGLEVPAGGQERMKWALKAGNKERWRWEFGQAYGLDFFNPYIDFEDFKVQLPGFKMGVLRYWNGQSLRYVLRNKRTKDVYLVIEFSLVLKDDLNEDGSLRVSETEAKENAAAERPQHLPAADDEGADSDHEIFKKLPETNADDVD